MTDGKAKPKVHNADSWTGDEEHQALPRKVIADPYSAESSRYEMRKALIYLCALLLVFALAGVARMFGVL